MVDDDAHSDNIKPDFFFLFRTLYLNTFYTSYIYQYSYEAIYRLNTFYIVIELLRVEARPK